MGVEIAPMVMQDMTVNAEAIIISVVDETTSATMNDVKLSNKAKIMLRDFKDGNLPNFDLHRSAAAAEMGEMYMNPIRKLAITPEMRTASSGAVEKG